MAVGRTFVPPPEYRPMSLFALLTTLLISVSPTAHEYHISKTNVRYVAEREQVQVEMHLFVEDLEKDMVAYGAPETLELGTKFQHEKAEALLADYLAEHFRISWNGAPLPLDIVGFEIEDDLHGFWIYFSADQISPPKEIEVTATLLTQTFADQKNIVKIFNGEERGATLLMSKQRSVGEARF